MISRVDIQPLSIAKIKIFHQQPGFYRLASEEVPV